MLIPYFFYIYIYILNQLFNIYIIILYYILVFSQNIDIQIAKTKVNAY